ncbi:MAG: DUF3261 domain-containing protein [Myxococcota bacterium]
MTRVALALALGTLAAGASVGCGPPPGARAPEEAPDPGPLLPPDALPFDFQWRQRVTASWEDGSEGFEAVLQKREGELSLVGLTPMGTPAFVLSLSPAGVTFDNRTGRELPFPPAFVVADVQRVFYPWLPPAPEGLTGAREDVVRGVRVRERYRDGELVRRAFVRPDDPERRAVHVGYGPTPPGADAPSRVVLDNGWFGYRLVIETLDQQRL